MKSLANTLLFTTHMTDSGHDFYYTYKDQRYDPHFVYAVDKMNKKQLLELLLDPSASVRTLAQFKLSSLRDVINDE